MTETSIDQTVIIFRVKSYLQRQKQIKWTVHDRSCCGAFQGYYGEEGHAFDLSNISLSGPEPALLVPPSNLPPALPPPPFPPTTARMMSYDHVP